VPVVAPNWRWNGEAIDSEAISAAISAVEGLESCVWRQSGRRYSCPGEPRRPGAAYDAFCARSPDAEWSAVLARGIQLILAGDGDVGGLIGLHGPPKRLGWRIRSCR